MPYPPVPAYHARQQTALRFALEAQGIKTAPGGRGYHREGDEGPAVSVTEVLSRGAWWLEGADTSHGTAVHREIADELMGGELRHTVWRPAAEAWQSDPMEAFDAFRALVGFVPLAVEVPLVGTFGGETVYGTADVIGTSDAFLWLPWDQRGLIVVDWKSGLHGLDAMRQVATYGAQVWQAFASRWRYWCPMIFPLVVGLAAGGDWWPTRETREGTEWRVGCLRPVGPERAAEFGRLAEEA